MMAAEHPQSFVTDVEVLQELLHRYVATGRWVLGREVLRSFAELMHDRIEPVYEEDVHLAARLADTLPRISATWSTPRSCDAWEPTKSSPRTPTSTACRMWSAWTPRT